MRADQKEIGDTENYTSKNVPMNIFLQRESEEGPLKRYYALNAFFRKTSV